MARAVAVVASRSKAQDGIWLNRFWTNRHPTPEVLDKIAETLGGDLTFFDDNPPGEESQISSVSPLLRR